MPEQLGPDSVFLPLPAHVGVADESHIFHRLNSHDAAEFAFLFEPPKVHSFAYFVVQFLARHVGFLPVVGRDYAPIGLRAIVDDLPDGIEIFFSAAPDHVWPSAARYSAAAEAE